MSVIPISRSTCLCYAVVAAIMLAPSASHAAIFGTLSNFDTFNQTPVPCEGAEIELEGVHSVDVYNTYPSHYKFKDISEYVSGSTFGTRIRFEDYYFKDSSNVEHFAINPNLNPPNTNGHYAVNVADAEHFGFAVKTNQPTATRFFWLDKQGDGSYIRADDTPVAIPGPTWVYQPPAIPGDRPIIQAIVEIPEPEDPEPQLPDSIWMKIYEIEMERNVDLDELMSAPLGIGIVPQSEVEIETEWELLEGGVASDAGGELGDDNVKSVVRRYEFFKYTGLYTDEHEPMSLWDGSGDPPDNEMGAFIAANMVAANLDPIIVPEPSTCALLLLGTGLITAKRRRLS